MIKHCLLTFKLELLSRLKANKGDSDDNSKKKKM